MGVAGTGFIGRGLVMAPEHHSDVRLTGTLTRRPLGQREGLPGQDLLTDSLAQWLDRCDLIVECSGDILHATEVVNAATQAKKPVVTLS